MLTQDRVLMVDSSGKEWVVLIARDETGRPIFQATGLFEDEPEVQKLYEEMLGERGKM